MSKFLTFSKHVLTGAISGGIVASIIMFSFLGSIGTVGQTNSVSGNQEATPNLGSSSNQEDLVVVAVKKAQPAVVSVIITKDVPVMEQYYDNSMQNPFGQFFGGNLQIPQYRQNGTEKKEVGGGSGFLVSADGYIVTNKHVVSDTSAEYTVFTNDGTKYPAKVLALDPVNDIAVIKIDVKDMPFLTFGDSDKLVAGQSVIAIGNPLMQFNNSVSVGVISGLSRSITAGGSGGFSEQLEGVIQTDAAINPGNSGGPLLNLKGEVIGVNVAVASAQSIAFSLPGNLVQKAADSVKTTGKIVRPYLGVRYMQITKDIKDKNKLSVDSGVLVAKGQTAEELAVLPGSPADKAGLKENDIILEADGKKLESGKTSLAQIVGQKQVGDKLKLKVLSQGKEKELEVILVEMPQ